MKSGAVEKGLAAVEDSLAFAKRVDHIDVVDYLGMCVDAHEAAGQTDRALMYLQELVDWRRKALDADVMQLEDEGHGKSSEFQTGSSDFDDTLRARSQRLQVSVQQRIEHLVETAIDAEVASGHDLYERFASPNFRAVLRLPSGGAKNASFR